MLKYLKEYKFKSFQTKDLKMNYIQDFMSLPMTDESLKVPSEFMEAVDQCLEFMYTYKKKDNPFEINIDFTKMDLTNPKIR